MDPVKTVLKPVRKSLDILTQGIKDMQKLLDNIEDALTTGKPKTRTKAKTKGAKKRLLGNLLPRKNHQKEPSQSNKDLQGMEPHGQSPWYLHENTLLRQGFGGLSAGCEIRRSSATHRYRCFGHDLRIHPRASPWSSA